MLRPRRHKSSFDKSGMESTGDPAPENDIDTQPGLRLAHEKKVTGQKPTRSSPLPWTKTVPTHRRERATEGLVVGCSVAEALSLSRNGIHPRVGLKLFGKNPLHFQFQPGVGVSSHRTHALLMTFQAMLQSKTVPENLSTNLKKRIAWYQRAFPIRHAYIHCRRLVRRVLRIQIDDSMTVGLADDPLVRSLVIGVMLQGCVDSASNWFQLCTGISHKDTRVLHASMLVGYAAQLAQMEDQQSFESISVLQRLIQVTEEPELRSLLEELSDSLTKNHTLATVAKRLGWKNGIPADVFASATIGIYAWLRHPKRFRSCVERTILLGGTCSGAAVVAGSLSGISLGRKGIPTEWLKRVSTYPHTAEWHELLIERVKDWPHGVDDIHKTLALPSRILGQVARNFSFSVFRVIHAIIRLPMKLTQFSVVKHVQHSRLTRGAKSWSESLNRQMGL